MTSHKREQQGLQVLAATKEREKKLNEFTIKELGRLEGDAQTYKAVGKMWVLLAGGPWKSKWRHADARLPGNCFLDNYRFLHAAPTEIVADLEKQNGATDKDVDALVKKREGIDRQISDLNNTLKDIVRTSGRA